MSNSARLYHHAHHFPSARHEAETAKLGMWIFLATEILLFSGLFMAYAAFRYTHADTFKTVHHLLDWKLGAVNTMVLIFSSLTMALAVRASQLSKQTQAVGYLSLTLVCGAAFLVVKYFEYTHKIELGTLPGGGDHGLWKPDYAALAAEHGAQFVEKLKTVEAPHLFMGLYFLMTGLHGLHVLIGMVVIAWVLLRTMRGDFSSKYFFPVENVGLYWHLVDLIWIYLFPLLYLVG